MDGAEAGEPSERRVVDPDDGDVAGHLNVPFAEVFDRIEGEGIAHRDDGRCAGSSGDVINGISNGVSVGTLPDRHDVLGVVGNSGEALQGERKL